MDQRSLRILEYDKIVSWLAEKAQTEPGRQLCRSLMPSEQLDVASAAQQDTDDAVKWLLTKGALPLYGISDIAQPVERSQNGVLLNCGQLMRVGQFLRAVSRLRRQFPSDETPQTAVQKALAALLPQKNLEKRLDEAIAGEDELHDTASIELASIRKKIRNAQADVKESLNRLVKSHARLLQDQLVTLRGNRYVVPLKAEHRGDLPGIVHDTSASGATLFVEPLPVVELNNRIREMYGLEREEIERILQVLSAQVAEVAEPILENLMITARLDFLMAKGQLALDMKAMPPKMNQEGRIRLKAARHPLIEADVVVPINFELGDVFQTLVITGPNTGGKTVSLKTCGLLCLMGMAGLQIPAQEGSEISVFNQVLADIGDEQSIEQSLSTFSSHMRNIVQITSEADHGMLVLVDELGSGTDPSEGAALAMAVLDHLRRRGCRTVATTHYQELKAYALRTEGVENACCEFDTETLRPTYRLLIGIPGVSNAFVISKRLGLHPDIIDQARQLLSEEGIRFEELIASVEQQSRESEKIRQEIELLRAEARQEKETLEKARKELSQQKKKILQQAREETREMYQQAFSEVESMMDQIREKIHFDQLHESERMADQMRHQIREGLNQVEGAIGRETLRSSGKKIAPDQIVAGMLVTAPQLGLTGKVAEGPDNRGNCQIQTDDGMKISVPAAALQAVGKGPQQQRSSSGRDAKGGRRSAGSVSVRSQKRMNASTEIKLLGQTVEEALSNMDRFIDDAVLAGIASIRIVHGKGTGALRSAVHQQLRRDSRVKSFRLGAFGEGDSGVTLAELQ